MPHPALTQLRALHYFAAMPPLDAHLRDWLLLEDSMTKRFEQQGKRVSVIMVNEGFVGREALADEAPGFVWRLQDDSGNAMDISYSPDPLLAVNMSVWTGAETLFDFVYRSAHTPVMAKRREYFQRFDGVYQALWWIKAGTVPTVNDALSRLWLLEQFGPCPQAVTFKAQFPRPDEVGFPVDHQPDPWCLGNA